MTAQPLPIYPESQLPLLSEASYCVGLLSMMLTLGDVPQYLRPLVSEALARFSQARDGVRAAAEAMEGRP